MRGSPFLIQDSKFKIQDSKFSFAIIEFERATENSKTRHMAGAHSRAGAVAQMASPRVCVKIVDFDNLDSSLSL